jgi:hypothetical protein
MSTPNKIPGMILKGINRAPAFKHSKKENRSYLQMMARAKKAEREKKQYEKANRE